MYNCFVAIFYIALNWTCDWVDWSMISSLSAGSGTSWCLELFPMWSQPDDDQLIIGWLQEPTGTHDPRLPLHQQAGCDLKWFKIDIKAHVLPCTCNTVRLLGSRLSMNWSASASCKPHFRRQSPLLALSLRALVPFSASTTYIWLSWLL